MDIQTLQRIPLLETLSTEELAQLNEIVVTKHAEKGSYVLHADDPGACLMFVLEGSLKVTLTSNEGKEVMLALLEEGEFFGEISVLTGEDRSANVVALNKATLLVLHQADFEKHIDKFTGLSRALLRALALRLKAASEKIGDLTLLDVYRRVARTLKNLSKPTEDGDTRTFVITERPTHQNLAALTGTSREMVTRALKGLEEDGHIEVEGKKITIFSMPI